MKASDITVVSAEVPQAAAQPLADWLAEQEIFASTWEDREGGPSRVEIFLEDLAGANDAAASIVAAGRAVGLGLTPTIGTLKAEDWSESWKRFFTVVHVSPHLVVRPPWEDYAPAQGERVLVLDPGMSFGTGKHATTQACMGFLDELAQADPHRDVLDVGCGSGILSIAAAKLGFDNVRGIDNDEDAVRIAGENAAANDIEAAFQTQDLAVCDLQATVVVANVLAPVLIQFAESIARCVRRVPGNALILSGILETQYDDVRDAYAALGFRERKNILIGEWKSGLFELTA
ncbi:MAG: 50S ribosomal protein L11 methyltransferase [Kiritimatiellae bacterium]|nr:50S ribosomal protein L11 methyltransferase [Kiritimatiellia bacterium]